MDLVLFFSLGIVPLISLLIYRRYFHPLSHIPGPPLAKITYLYEWYYDLYRGGQFTFQLPALHRKYGKSSPWSSSSCLLYSAPSLTNVQALLFVSTPTRSISTIRTSSIKSSTKRMGAQRSPSTSPRFSVLFRRYGISLPTNPLGALTGRH